jgi:methyl-accepting chemotaxis protein
MAFLQQLKFRIGTKLGLSAGLGVLMVAGMAANQYLTNREVLDESELAMRRARLTEEVLETKASVRGMVIAGREVRLAQTSEQLKAAVESLSEKLKSAQERADTALSLTLSGENRDRLNKIKGLIADYMSVAMDNAHLSEQRLVLQDNRSHDADEWTKILNTVLSSPALGNLANHHDVEAGLHEADYFYLLARNASWRYQVVGDPEGKEIATRNAERAGARLKEVRNTINDAALLPSFDLLAKNLTEFKNADDETIAVEERRMKNVRERANPAIVALERAIGETVDVVNKLSAQVNSETRWSIERSIQIGLGVGALVMLLQIGSAVFSVFNIARPIASIGRVLLALANGNKTVDIPHAGRGDEVGDTARAAKTFKDNLVRIEKMEAEQKATDARASEQRKADMHKLADQFQAAVGDIVGAVSSASTELEASARTLTKTAESTQGLSTTVAAASEEASANVNSVASATEQLAASVNEIGRQVKESSKIASEAVQQAHRTDARITELSQAASRIGDVIKLITSVAEQTNLLALNATIEAARAGEAGKGFAVVAQEVKALAAQTAKATDEIGTQIAGMQTATEESVAAIKEIGGTISRMSDIAAAIASTVEEQSSATREISHNVQEAAQGTAQVATNITDVNRGAAETGSASTQVLASAQSLSKESNHLKLEVDKFLATVRAA